MTVKELIDQLSSMAPEKEVFLAIYLPGDSGDQDHFRAVGAVGAVEYEDKDGGHVQIKGY